MSTLLSAYQVEAELKALLAAAGVDYWLVSTCYDDALDCEVLRVMGDDLDEKKMVPAHALVYSIEQFSAEVLAPFVEKMRKS